MTTETTTQPERGRISKIVLETVLTAVTEDNAAAPNAIGEIVYEKLCDNGVGEELAEAISGYVFELVSELVANYGSGESTGDIDLGYL